MKPLTVSEARQELLSLYQAALPHLAERRNRGGDGLTRLQMHVLHILDRDGPQPMREVAACLGVTPTSVTEIGNASPSVFLFDKTGWSAGPTAPQPLDTSAPMGPGQALAMTADGSGLLVLSAGAWSPLAPP